MTSQRRIVLRGVRVHNLKSIDLDIPHHRLVVLCGRSGAGKSSLAFDTLYAEGQRRYIESFSAYTRQFLEQLDKPDADVIEGIPAAIAVAQRTPRRSSRSTLGTVTEINDHLRLLLAKIGQVFCYNCGQRVVQDTPESAAERVADLPDGVRFMVAFEVPIHSAGELRRQGTQLRESGFVRVLWQGKTATLDATTELPEPPADEAENLTVIVDRLAAGKVEPVRLRESLETAFQQGSDRALVLLPVDQAPLPDLPKRQIDGADWAAWSFSTRLRCETCGINYPAQEPRLYSFNSPLGACPECEGFGSIHEIDMDLVVPDRAKSLREGAIAPWNTPAYAHELEELLALAKDYSIDVDAPYSELPPKSLELIQHGVAEREFGGLDGFFRWLQRKKYKMHIRVFLSRWRSYRTCPTCQGQRLRPEALATKIAGRSMADLCALKVCDAGELFRDLQLSPRDAQVGQVMLSQVRNRLSYLDAVGLGYLTLDRTLRTLSGGESQRVALTSALGSSLVNMLYVLDEPSIGLHPADTQRLLETVQQLRRRGNTVVVVEHEEVFIRSAEQVIEIGPFAGQNGGKVTFQGTPEELINTEGSITGDYLAGRRISHSPAQRRPRNRGHLRLDGARGNNLQNLSVEFPLGVLCVVTGVSGSGKSTLVEGTLYPALCERKRKEVPVKYPFDLVVGDGQIDDVLLVDQSPIGKSPRSNPVTYLKIFDAIRAVFAETLEARTRNYTASHFSFNVDGGRCEKCQGEGHVTIDMQFLADVYMKCPQCHGTRYKKEILQARYRGKNIAEVLDMTVREAFSFFRGQKKVLTRLKLLIDAGLDYLRLGQGANTLSGGEAQRLKLAGFTASAKKGRTLFILDEPTTGLHPADVVQLMDSFDALLAVGHSLIVVEHNLQLIKAADYVIDLGPGAADAGGQIVATGTPEELAANEHSLTGKFLAAELTRDAELMALAEREG